MKTSRSFILTASLLMAALWPSQACIDYEDPSHFNLFYCAPDMPDIDAKRLDESVQFWSKYLGVKADQDFANDVKNIYEYQLDEEEEGNLFITTLRKQGKTDALQLVKLNFELNQLTGSSDGWYYRKATPAEYNALLTKIDALRLSGDLSRRKTFLKMRCLFALKDYDACMRLWEMFASKWEDSPLKQRAYGYVAGIYFRKGQFEKAMQIYFEQGDAGSIRMCVNRILQNSTIEQEYEKDPNAPILAHFLEDYANYFYHSTFDEYWKSEEKDNPIWSAVNRQREKMLKLADRVIQEGKTDDPQMWQAFIGFVQLAYGDNDQAYQSLDKAEHMKKGIMAERIGIYKLAASLKASQKPADFEDYVGRTLAYYFNAQYNDSYSEATRNIIYSAFSYEISNRLNEYFEANKPAYMQLLGKLAFSTPRRIFEFDYNNYKSEDIIPILALVKDGTSDVLTKTLLDECGIRADACNEYIGTLLMREGKFQEAEPYLSNVSQSYIWDLSIEPYLFMRELPEQVFVRKNMAEYYDMEHVNGNPKLKFCRQLIELQKQVQDGKKDEKARAAIQLANLLFQGSPAGDLWAMSQYSWSQWGPVFNQFDVMAVDLLHTAIASTKDYDLLCQAYFGLAAIPIGNYQISTIASTGIFYAEEPEQLETYKTNIEGYRWLIKQSDRSHFIYQTCDWLKLYSPGSLD